MEHVLSITILLSSSESKKSSRQVQPLDILLYTSSYSMFFFFFWQIADQIYKTLITGTVSEGLDAAFVNRGNAALFYWMHLWTIISFSAFEIT